jgi:hypothetical protein
MYLLPFLPHLLRPQRQQHRIAPGPHRQVRVLDGVLLQRHVHQILRRAGQAEPTHGGTSETPDQSQRFCVDTKRRTRVKVWSPTEPGMLRVRPRIPFEQGPGVNGR